MPVLEERGYFWWAEEPIPEGKFAPDSLVTGLVRVAEDGRAELELDGTMPSEHGVFGRLAEPIIAPSKRIKGILRNGKHVLLYELTRAGPNKTQLAGAGISFESFHAGQSLIADDEVAIGEEALGRLELLAVELKGYEGWLFLRDIKTSRTEDHLSATYDKPDDLLYSLGDSTLTLAFELYGPSYFHGLAVSQEAVTLRQAVSLKYLAPLPLTSERAAIIHGLVSDLLLLFTGSNFSLEWPTLHTRDEKTSATLYYARHKADTRPPNPMDWWVTFPEIRENFGKLFSAWLTKREQFGPGFYLYLGTRRNMQFFVEHVFMNLVWGLESFHRTKHGDSAPRRKLTAKIERIIHQVQRSDDRRWLKKKLEDTAEPTLGERLHSLFSDPVFELDEPALRRFTDSCAKLRNDISHYGGQREKRAQRDYQQFILDLHKRSEVLGYIYHALILKEIGLNSDALRKALTRSAASYKMRYAMSEFGLVPSPNPGASTTVGSRRPENATGAAAGQTPRGET